MSTQTIPAKTLIHCDICKKDCTKHGRQQSGRLIIECDALDWQGAPVANGGYQRDLCDDCLSELNDALRVKAEEINARSLLSAAQGESRE